MKYNIDKYYNIIRFFKPIFKFISYEILNSILCIPSVFLIKKFQNSANEQFNKEETGKLVAYFKNQGKFKIQYIKRKYGYNGYYNQRNNTVYSSQNKYILSHELAHATSVFNINDKIFKNISKFSYLITNNLNLIGYLNILLNSEFVSNSSFGKYSKFTVKGLNNTSKIASLFVLAEEAQASIRAVNVVHKELDPKHALEATKLLLLGYSTYMWSIFKDLIIVPNLCKWLFNTNKSKELLTD